MRIYAEILIADVTHVDKKIVRHNMNELLFTRISLSCNYCNLIMIDDVEGKMR